MYAHSLCKDFLWYDVWGKTLFSQIPSLHAATHTCLHLRVQLIDPMLSFSVSREVIRVDSFCVLIKMKVGGGRTIQGEMQHAANRCNQPQKRGSVHGHGAAGI